VDEKLRVSPIKVATMIELLLVPSPRTAAAQFRRPWTLGSASGDMPHAVHLNLEGKATADIVQF
jgi:hypothetical protein